MELPLLVRRTALDPLWKGKYKTIEKMKEHIKADNETAELLTIIIDIDNADWGKPDLGINTPSISGTVIVVRQDKKNITKDQVRTLAVYIEKFIMEDIAAKRTTVLNSYICTEQMIRRARAQIVEELVNMEGVRKNFKSFWPKKD
jgi:hypothetical protein